MVTKELLKNEIDTVISAKTIKKHSKEQQQEAMNEFCGMFDDLDVNNVEETLRSIRKGRRERWNAL